MAVQRSRRLRKKLHIDEFQEIGFTVAFTFPADTSVEAIDSTVDALIDEVIEPNGLAFDGSGYLQWQGLVCLQKTGKCTEEHRELVKNWLTARNLNPVEVSELLDIWWD